MKHHSLQRRRWLLTAASLPLTAIWSSRWAQGRSRFSFEAELAGLEKDLQGRLGLFVIDTGNDAQLSYRADERFPMCSTFKMMLVSAVLQKSVQDNALLQRHVSYGREDFNVHSPVTERHADTGMTVEVLCAAALQYSDGTAANLLVRLLGGVSAITSFARSIGDDMFRLDRWEPELSTALPGDPRDTSTPQAMAKSLRRLVLGDALPAGQRRQLQDWLRGNTTGAERIQAGIPADWVIGDKTGSGSYGRDQIG